MLLPVISLVFAFEVQKKWAPIKKPLILLLSLLCLFLNFDSRVFGTFLKGIHPSYVLASTLHIGGAAKAWLRINLKPGQKALSTGDNYLYYVLHLNIHSVRDDKNLYQQLKSLTSLKDRLEHLQTLGFQYLLDSRHFKQNWGPFALEVGQAVSKYPAGIVFGARDSIIVDINLLLKEMTQ